MSKRQARPHITEYKAFSDSDKANGGEFSEVHADVFRAELAILMDESLKRQVVTPIKPEITPPHKTAPFTLGEFVNQNRAYVVHQIALRLHMTEAAVKQRLREISAFVWGNPNMDLAPDYLPKLKPRGRPRKPRKDEKAIVHNGRSYKSIAEAARKDTERSYAALRQKLWRESKKQSTTESKLSENSI